MCTYAYNILLLFCLQHLRVEENPILKMPHLEAASILLVGPTLKKLNDRGMLGYIFYFFSFGILVFHLAYFFPHLYLSDFHELVECCIFTFCSV